MAIVMMMMVIVMMIRWSLSGAWKVRLQCGRGGGDQYGAAGEEGRKHDHDDQNGKVLAMQVWFTAYMKDGWYWYVDVSVGVVWVGPMKRKKSAYLSYYDVVPILQPRERCTYKGQRKEGGQDEKIGDDPDSTGRSLPTCVIITCLFTRSNPPQPTVWGPTPAHTIFSHINCLA